MKISHKQLVKDFKYFCDSANILLNYLSKKHKRKKPEKKTTHCSSVGWGSFSNMKQLFHVFSFIYGDTGNEDYRSLFKQRFLTSKYPRTGINNQEYFVYFAP